MTQARGVDGRTALPTSRGEKVISKQSFKTFLITTNCKRDSCKFSTVLHALNSIFVGLSSMRNATVFPIPTWRTSLVQLE